MALEIANVGGVHACPSCRCKPSTSAWRGFFTKAAVAVGVCLLLSLGGCGITGPVPPPGTPGIVACSDTALHDATLNILPSVETALATASYEQALATLIAGIAGPLALQEVECAVAWVADHAAMAETATGDPIEATKAKNARKWLAAHPVQFQ